MDSPRVRGIFFIPRDLAVLQGAELHLQVGTHREPGQQGARELHGDERGRVPANRERDVTHPQHGSVPPRRGVRHRVGHLLPGVVQLHGGWRLLLRGGRGLALVLLLRLPRLLLALGEAVGDPGQHLAQRLVLVPQHALVGTVQPEGDGELRLPGETPHRGGLHPPGGSGQSPRRGGGEQQAAGEQREDSGEAVKHEVPGGRRRTPGAGRASCGR